MPIGPTGASGRCLPQYGFAGLKPKETYGKWKLVTKAEWTANNASMFDASPFGYDKERRAAFLRVAEEFFDQESQNSWDGQFTESGRSSTDDSKARSQYFRESRS